MANYCSNWVMIKAPERKVKKYLIFDLESKCYRFNMYLLFPKAFGIDNQDGLKGGGKNDWAWENTGTRSFPEIGYINEDCNGFTTLSYETIWEPNNGTMEKLHRLTQWPIKNEYDEPKNEIEGTFMCLNNDCFDFIREKQD